jgi:mannosylglycerate hydrolase
MPEPLTLVVVPHTHWDREWYLTFQQFRARLVRCVDHLLQILDTDPAFTHFMLDGQMIVLADYLEVRPENAGRLQHYARAGRIQVGPWYVQPDEFLVSGEALIRNLLVGRRLAEPYGGALAVGYVPDTFGHIAQLPQILRGFGIDNAVFWRGVGADVSQSEFWWAAPDGSRVLAAYLCGDAGYSNARELPLATDELLKRLDYISEPMRPHATANALLLMNGSDHLEPQAGLPAALAAAKKRLRAEGMQVRLGTIPDYLRLVCDAHPDLATYRGECRSPQRAHLLPGVLSTRLWIKARNAAGEERLTRWAEPLAAWAGVLGEAPAPGLLDLAWRFLLQNQPHDSICGCSIDQVHVEMVTRYDQCDQLTEEIIHESGEVIARQVHTRALVNAGDGIAYAGSVPVVVLNPTAGPRQAVAEAQVQLAAPAETLLVCDAEGRALPHAAETLQGRELFRQALPAEHLESLLTLVEQGRVLGYRVLGMLCTEPDAAGTVRVRVEVSDHGEPDLAFTDAAMARLRAEAERPDVQSFDLLITESSWSTVRFAAPDLPAYGGRAYLIRMRQPGDPAVPASDISAADTWIENAWLRVAVDPASGLLTVTDKATGQMYPGLHRFEDGGDVGDLYNYAPPATDRVVTQPVAPPEVTLVEANAVRATLRLRQIFALPARAADDRQVRADETVGCAITSEITLKTGARRVEILTTGVNTAEDHRLRVVFPTGLMADAVDAEGTFMVNRRPVQTAAGGADWMETPAATQPQKGFVDASDGTRGLALLSRGLPEYEATQEAEETVGLALTLLRCVGWLSRDDFATRRGHAGPMLPTPAAQEPGPWRADYALVPHAGTWRDEVLVPREAEAYANPVRTLPTDLHEGMLPPAWSFVRLAPAILRLSAIKPAEDGQSLIIRWYNPAEDEVIAQLATYIPFEAAALVSLNEDLVRDLAVDETMPQQHWRVPTPGGGIVTVRLAHPAINSGMH